jgi:N-acyl homoserine lactone hydrolase
MTEVTKVYPLLTGKSRYEKTLSTRDRGTGQILEAPILVYLIETKNSRILYDVGCDYKKISDPNLRHHYYENFLFGPPEMEPEQQISNYLNKLGLTKLDIDIVFCGHLHFDHAGGLCEFFHAEVYVHRAEMEAAKAQADEAYFLDDFSGDYRWHEINADYNLVDGVRAIETPGHTAGHMSMVIELPEGPPIIIAGDAADLVENIENEIAPGLCWQDNVDLAIESIRKLKQIRRETGAELWPNHDIQFYKQMKPFPLFYE